MRLIQFHISDSSARLNSTESIAKSWTGSAIGSPNLISEYLWMERQAEWRRCGLVCHREQSSDLFVSCCISTINKQRAYTTLVRPHLENASAVWDPYRQHHINSIEMVQCRAARFVTSNYQREPGTVTTILQNLGWPTLETRRKAARLILLFKILHWEAAITIPVQMHFQDVVVLEWYRPVVWCLVGIYLCFSL